MGVFIILQLFRSVRLRHKYISGENKKKKEATLQEIQPDGIFEHP